MKKLFIALMALGASHAALAAPELKGSPSELSHYLLEARKIISINDSAELKVEADQAIVALTIKNEAKTLDGAIDENERLQKAVKKALLADGIAVDKIKAANFSSTPDYGWLKDKPKSYEISRELKVTIANASQMRAIARVVDSIDEVFLGTMSFEDSAKQDNELKSTAMVLEKIQARKALYEKSFGVKLDLVKVSSHGVSPVYARPRHLRAMEGDRFSSGVSVSMVETAEPESDQFAGITYRSSATAEFVIVE